MPSKSLVLVLAAASLAGCDAATQIAGEAVEAEARNAVAAQCEQVAQNAGIVAGRVAEVCRCSADTFMADSELTLDDVNRERIEEIVNACAERTGAAGSNSAGSTTAEEIGG